MTGPLICFESWGEVPGDDFIALSLLDPSGEQHFAQHGFHLVNDGDPAYEITLEAFEISPSVVTKSATISRIERDGKGFALVSLDGSPSHMFAVEKWDLIGAMAKASAGKYGNSFDSPDFSVIVSAIYRDADEQRYRSTASLTYIRTQRRLAFGPTTRQKLAPAKSSARAAEPLLKQPMDRKSPVANDDRDAATSTDSIRSVAAMKAADSNNRDFWLTAAVFPSASSYVPEKLGLAVERIVGEHEGNVRKAVIEALSGLRSSGDAQTASDLIFEAVVKMGSELFIEALDRYAWMDDNNPPDVYDDTADALYKDAIDFVEWKYKSLASEVPGLSPACEPSRLDALRTEWLQIREEAKQEVHLLSRRVREAQADQAARLQSETAGYAFGGKPSEEPQPGNAPSSGRINRPKVQETPRSSMDRVSMTDPIWDFGGTQNRPISIKRLSGEMDRIDPSTEDEPDDADLKPEEELRINEVTTGGRSELRSEIETVFSGPEWPPPHAIIQAFRRHAVKVFDVNAEAYRGAMLRQGRDAKVALNAMARNLLAGLFGREWENSPGEGVVRIRWQEGVDGWNGEEIAVIAGNDPDPTCLYHQLVGDAIKHRYRFHAPLPAHVPGEPPALGVSNLEWWQYIGLKERHDLAMVVRPYLEDRISHWQVVYAAPLPKVAAQAPQVPTTNSDTAKDKRLTEDRTFNSRKAASEPPKGAELGPGGLETNVNREYPAWRRHWTKKEVTVKDAAEDEKLGGGWAASSAAFAPYRGPRPPRTDAQDPAKWVEGWSLSDLSPKDRNKIKAQLLRADSEFWKSPDADSAPLAAMKFAFDGIAKVLFESGILTEQFLQNEVPLLVWDSAIAGGWYRFASETPERIFPDRLGHYYVWRDETKDWPGLFRAETAKWLAELLEASSESPATEATPTAPGSPASASGASRTNCDPQLWRCFSYERTSKASKFLESLIRNFVNSSVPAHCTNRDVLERIAKESRIPIESLPDDINQPVFSRGQALFGFAGDEFDRVAKDYVDMEWWLSDTGLNMAVVSPTISARRIPTFDELMRSRLAEIQMQEGQSEQLQHDKRSQGLATALEKAQELSEPRLREMFEAVIRYNWYSKELRALKVATKKYQTPDLLKKQFPEFEVWAVLDKHDQEDIANANFDPGRFSWSLVKRLNSLEGKDDRTLKNYRRRLRAAGILV